METITKHDLGSMLSHWEKLVGNLMKTAELNLVEISYLRKRNEKLEKSLREAVAWAQDSGGDLAAREVARWNDALDPKATITAEDFGAAN